MQRDTRPLSKKVRNRMPEARRIAVIGAGPGGYVAALRGAQLGAKVTIIEDREVGGTCLNRGCIPSKAIISCVDVLDKIKKSEEFGIKISGEVTPDLSRIIDRKNKIVGTLIKGIHSLFKSWGVELIEGRGSLADKHQVQVVTKGGEERTVSADSIILATGSRPAKIPMFPFDGKRVMTSDDVLDMRDLPSSILIVGGGVIGCEFASIYSGLGVEVTIVELLPRILATEDEEIASLLERELKKRDVKVITGVKVEKVEDGQKLRSTLSDGRVIESDKILVSIGRELCSGGLNLDKIGVTLGKRGEVLVNEWMETSIPGIFAIGDLVGGLLLAHKASAEGKVAAVNCIDGEEEMDYSIVPAGIFTLPEIGTVGLKESEARDRGIGVKVGRFNFRGLGKSQAMGELSGMVKVVSDEKTKRVVGVHIIGPHATDLIHEAAVAMKIGATYEKIADTIHAHPTLSEALMEAMEDVGGVSIHTPKKKG